MQILKLTLSQGVLNSPLIVLRGVLELDVSYKLQGRCLKDRSFISGIKGTTELGTQSVMFQFEVIMYMVRMYMDL